MVQTVGSRFLAKIIKFEVENDTLADVGALKHDAHFGLAGTTFELDLRKTLPPARIGKERLEHLIANFGIDIGSLDGVALFAGMTNPQAVVAQPVLTVLQILKFLIYLIIAKSTT